MPPTEDISSTLDSASLLKVIVFGLLLLLKESLLCVIVISDSNNCCFRFFELLCKRILYNVDMNAINDKMIELHRRVVSNVIDFDVD